MTNSTISRIIPGGRWNLTYDGNNWNSMFSGKSAEVAASSLCEMEFEFLEDGERLQESFNSDQNTSTLDDDHQEEDDEEKSNNNGCESAEENRSFWESQHEALKSTLCRSSSLESRIRNATKEALKEIQVQGNNVCGCGKMVSSTNNGCCKNCLMREVTGRLRNAGFNSAICKSKWRSSPHIPSGEHTFLDVVDNSSSKKGEVRVIIELNFRAEFEMARASEEYSRLVRRLPEVFVGKKERLNNVIKIVCLAAKKCMKEKKMHLGPWRKQKYVQAKWLGTNYERITTSTPVLSSLTAFSNRLPKPKASMLTVDLLDNLPNMHCTAVAVV